MIALFSLEPRSVLLAHMLSRLRGAKAVPLDPARQYFFNDVKDMREADYDSIYSEYRERFGPIDFLEDRKLYEIVSGEIFWALRHRARDSSSLVLKVLDQIASDGAKQYLSETSSEAREMRARVRRVLSEFNRALRFISFTRYERPALMIANASFENDIGDMLLRAQARRSPGQIVAIYDDRSVSMLINGEPYLGKRQKVPLSPDRRDFQTFWSGLPESGKTLIRKDEVHSLKELPTIELLAQRTETAPSLPREGGATLDDFA